MAVAKTGAAAGEFIAVALAKQHVAVDHDDDDALLSVYIAAAQRWIERTCDVLLTRAEYTYTGADFSLSFDGYTDPEIVSVSYVHNNGSQQSVTDFSIVDGALTVPDGLPAQSVTVVFNAGMTVVPEDYALAGLMLVSAFYEYRSETSEAQTASLPFGVKALLAPLRTFAR